MDRSGSANGNEKPAANNRMAISANSYFHHAPNASRHWSAQSLRDVSVIGWLGVHRDDGSSRRIENHSVQNARGRNDEAVPESHLALLRCALSQHELVDERRGHAER